MGVDGSDNVWAGLMDRIVDVVRGDVETELISGTTTRVTHSPDALGDRSIRANEHQAIGRCVAKGHATWEQPHVIGQLRITRRDVSGAVVTPSVRSKEPIALRHLNFAMLSKSCELWIHTAEVTRRLESDHEPGTRVDRRYRQVDAR